MRRLRTMTNASARMALLSPRGNRHRAKRSRRLDPHQHHRSQPRRGLRRRGLERETRRSARSANGCAPTPKDALDDLVRILRDITDLIEKRVPIERRVIVTKGMMQALGVSHRDRFTEDKRGGAP